jgi:hypothetical protein
MESSSEANPIAPDHHGDSSSSMDHDAAPQTGAIVQSMLPQGPSGSTSDTVVPDVVARASVSSPSPAPTTNTKKKYISPANFVKLSESTVGPTSLYADAGRSPRGVRYVARENAFCATIDDKVVGFYESEEVRSCAICVLYYY